MRKLVSSYFGVNTSGITEVVGPSERRVSLIMSPPATGVVWVAPTGVTGAAYFVLFPNTLPFTVTEAVWGPVVKQAWYANDFGTGRSIACVEVLEVIEPDPEPPIPPPLPPQTNPYRRRGRRG